MRKLALLISMLILLVAVVPTLGQDAAPTTAHIRVAHFSPDAPAVDIYVNGQKSAITNLTFPKVTDWVELPAGTIQVAVTLAGETNPVIGPAQLTLEAGAWLTVAAVGSAASGTLKPAVIVEDYQPIPESSARVTIFHAIEGAPAVDIAAGDTRILRELAYPGSRGNNDGAATLEVPSGSYNLTVLPFGRSQPVLLDLRRTIFVTGVNYLIAAVGTPDEPRVVSVATNPATLGK